MAGRFSISAIFSGKDYLSSAIRRVQSNFASSAKGMQANMKAISGANDKLLSSLNGVAKKATLAAAALGGVSAVGAALDVAKTASDFEQAITNVGAVSLMARDQIQDLEFKALDLARTTKFTATEVAGAMETMGKAGFTNAQIIQGIDGILAASAAEGLSIEETASHVSNVLKGMGLDNEDMGKNAIRVADVLALASARTNSSISSLGESMANVSATAKQLGVPLEQTVAAVAMLQDVGIDASTAGSAVNTMLTQMAAPSKKAAASMAQWGIKFEDAKGNMLPFMDVLQQLSKAAKKSGGNFDQIAFFAELVGLRGQKAAANLKDLFNSGKYQALAGELDAAAGSAKKMSDIRLNTLEGDVTLFKSSLDLVKIAAFEAAGKGLRPMVQQATDWLNKNKDLVASKATEYIKKFGEALPEIVTWLERLGRGAAALYAISTGVKAVDLALRIASASKGMLIFGALLTAATLLVAFWPEVKKFWNDNKIAIQYVAGALATLAVPAAIGQVATAITGVKTAAIAARAALVAMNGASFAGLLASLGELSLVLAPIVAMIAAIEAARAIKNSQFEKEDKAEREANQSELSSINEKRMARAKAISDNPDMVPPRVRGDMSWASGLGAGVENETTTNNNATLTIMDQTGRAVLTKKPKGPGIKLVPSGAM